MDNIFKSKVIWAQMDANRHLRHSAYADLAAQARIELLEAINLNMETFAKLKLGPILFREELVYLREITGSQNIEINTVLTKTRIDGSRWSIRHEVFREDGIKSAIINVDGAWLNMVDRKLTSLPEEYAGLFQQVPKSEDFVLEEISK
jgi:acyl-CoA thioester hydrolase